MNLCQVQKSQNRNVIFNELGETYLCTVVTTRKRSSHSGSNLPSSARHASKRVGVVVFHCCKQILNYTKHSQTTLKRKKTRVLFFLSSAKPVNSLNGSVLLWSLLNGSTVAQVFTLCKVDKLDRLLPKCQTLPFSIPDNSGNSILRVKMGLLQTPASTILYIGTTFLPFG